jgi:hypothetical protein
MTGITAAEFERRHTFCITTAAVQVMLRDTLRRQPDFKVTAAHRQAHCDHPEDGYCCGPGGTIPDAKLAEVNAALDVVAGRARAALVATRTDQRAKARADKKAARTARTAAQKGTKKKTRRNLKRAA